MAIDAIGLSKIMEMCAEVAAGAGTDEGVWSTKTCDAESCVVLLLNLSHR